MKLIVLFAAAYFACPLFAAQQTAIRSAPLSFFELTVQDLARAKNFYGQLFGWTFANSPSPDFVTIQGAGLAGGMLREPDKKPGNGGAKIFFAVNRISDCLERAKHLGAEVLLPETRVSATRALAEFRDPEGNVIGIIHDESRLSSQCRMRSSVHPGC